MVGHFEFIWMLLISAAVGGLIGIEREPKVKVVAGIRTFALTSMLGASAACVVSAVGSTLNKITISWINGTSALSRYLAVPTGLVAFLSLIDLLFKTW